MNVDENVACAVSTGAFDSGFSQPQRAGRAAVPLIRRIGMILTSPRRLDADVRTCVTARVGESS